MAARIQLVVALVFALLEPAVVAAVEAPAVDYDSDFDAMACHPFQRRSHFENADCLETMTFSNRCHPMQNSIGICQSFLAGNSAEIVMVAMQMMAIGMVVALWVRMPLAVRIVLRWSYQIHR